MTVLLWTFHLVLQVIGSLIADYDETAALIFGRAVSTAFGLLLCWVIYLVLERLQGRSFARQVVVMASLGLPAAVAHSVASRYAFHLIAGETPPADVSLTAYLQLSSYWFFFFLAWAAVILALIYSFRIHLEQRMRSDALALAHRAQMEALRYQLNPHFLFNTLNSIATLILEDEPQAAERMIRKMSDFLRNGLASDPLEDIRLRSEIDQQRVYLDIERARFPDRLSVEVDVPPELESALVPSFILQTLVENAVKYGVAPSTGRTTIRIGASAQDGTLSLSVADDGAVESDKRLGGTGIGLRNIEQRLAARFGDRYSFRAGPLARGFEAVIHIPLRIAE